MFEEVKVQLETADVTVEERVTDEGLQDTERPVDGVMALVTVTVPVKPLRLWSVRLDVPEEPTGRLREDGAADMLKSTTFTVTVIE